MKMYYVYFIDVIFFIIKKIYYYMGLFFFLIFILFICLVDFFNGKKCYISEMYMIYFYV